MKGKASKADNERVSKLLTEIFDVFKKKIDHQDAKLDDLFKMLKSHEVMLAEHQRVLRILFNENQDKTKN